VRGAIGQIPLHRLPPCRVENSSLRRTPSRRACQMGLMTGRIVIHRARFVFLQKIILRRFDTLTPKHSLRFWLALCSPSKIIVAR
jgi:hypothetical protein